MFRRLLNSKVTDNDTNITGLKSHDCHIMMQCLLPYGLQNYLPDKIAKPIIDLCSLFKQICSATLMEDDMLKAQIKVVDILCELELIYTTPAIIDIMLLVYPFTYEAREGGPISPPEDTLFDLRPHMDSSRWTEIYEGINQHLQKAYNTNKASFKAKHWNADPTTGTYDVEAIRRARSRCGSGIAITGHIQAKYCHHGPHTISTLPLNV
ncbi:hypothetical protein Tco_0087450 [Tanacetum coccineum]